MTDMKKCPSCGEEVKLEAIKCKHCKTMLSEENNAPVDAAAAASSQQAAPKVKKPIWKRWWVWVIVGLLVIGMFGGGNGNDEEVADEPEEEMPSFNWETAELTEANVRDALSQEFTIDPIYDDGDFPEDITLITVEENNITIKFKPETMWDETDFVKRVGGTAIIAGSILFDNPDVVWVKAVAIIEMTDQYGKTEDEEGVYISLDRELADKADWEGLADRHSSDPGNIYRLSAEHYIHPGIRKNVKLDEVKVSIEGEDLSNEALEQVVLTLMQDNFKDMADIEFVQEDETFYITPTDPGFTLEAFNASEGDPDALEGWDGLVDSFKDMSESTKEMLPGYLLSLRNPANPENVLLIVSDGSVIYNFIED